MTINFDPGVYARLSPEVRLHALGLMPTKQEPFRSFEELGAALGQPRAKPGLIDRKLDEVSRTKRASTVSTLTRPFTATPTMRAFFARYNILPKLAAYIAGQKPIFSSALSSVLTAFLAAADFGVRLVRNSTKTGSFRDGAVQRRANPRHR
jgi:hypothetical protein